MADATWSEPITEHASCDRRLVVMETALGTGAPNGWVESTSLQAFLLAGEKKDAAGRKKAQKKLNRVKTR